MGFVPPKRIYLGGPMLRHTIRPVLAGTVPVL